MSIISAMYDIKYNYRCLVEIKSTPEGLSVTTANAYSNWAQW